MGAVLLAAAAVAYNNLINRWPAFASRAYVPANLVAGSVAVACGVLFLGLDRAAIGLRFDGAALGLPWVGAAAFGLGVALGVPRARRAMRDRRLEGLAGARAALHVLARIPVGTALFEETVFRGVLYAAFAGEGTGAAAVASSIAFGLWHVEPTRLLVRANRPEASARAVVVAALGGVVVTFAAGMFLAWLRARGGGIAAPIVVHAGINSLGAVAAMIALRLDPMKG